MTEAEVAELLYAAGQFDARNLPATDIDAMAKARVWGTALAQVNTRQAAAALSSFYRYARERAVQPGDLLERIEADRPREAYTAGRGTPQIPAAPRSHGMPADFWEQAAAAADPPYWRADGSLVTTADEFMAEANLRRKAAGLPAVALSGEAAGLLR